MPKIKHILIAIIAIILLNSCERETLPFRYLEDEYGNIYNVEIDKNSRCNCIKLTKIDTSELDVKAIKYNRQMQINSQ